jgi:hypothetical protein
LDRYKYPIKSFFEFFSSISWGLCTGTNLRKSGTFRIYYRYSEWEIKFLFFKYSKFTFTTGAKFEKYHFLVFSTSTKTPRNRRKKFKTKFFFEYLYRSKELIFGAKKILVSGTAFQRFFFLN